MKNNLLQNVILKVCYGTIIGLQLSIITQFKIYEFLYVNK